MGTFISYVIRIFKGDAQNGNKNITLNAMHWINRVSILMFLVAIVLLALKWKS